MIVPLLYLYQCFWYIFVLFQASYCSVIDVHGEWQAAVYITLCCALLFPMFPLQKWSGSVTDCTNTLTNLSWW